MQPRTIAYPLGPPGWIDACPEIGYLIVTAVLFVLGTGTVFLSTIAKAGDLVTAPRAILTLTAVGARIAL